MTGSVTNHVYTQAPVTAAELPKKQVQETISASKVKKSDEFVTQKPKKKGFVNRVNKFISNCKKLGAGITTYTKGFLGGTIKGAAIGGSVLGAGALGTKIVDLSLENSISKSKEALNATIGAEGFESITEKANSLIDAAKANNLTDKAKDVIKNVKDAANGEKFSAFTTALKKKEFIEKTGDFRNTVSETVKDKGTEIIEKSTEFAENIVNKANSIARNTKVKKALPFVAGGLALATLGIALWKSKLNLNEKRSDIEHRYEGHNNQ